MPDMFVCSVCNSKAFPACSIRRRFDCGNCSRNKSIPKSGWRIRNEYKSIPGSNAGHFRNIAYKHIRKHEKKQIFLKVIYAMTAHKRVSCENSKQISWTIKLSSFEYIQFHLWNSPDKYLFISTSVIFSKNRGCCLVIDLIISHRRSSRHLIDPPSIFLTHSICCVQVLHFNISNKTWDMNIKWLIDVGTKEKKFNSQTVFERKAICWSLFHPKQ